MSQFFGSMDSVARGRSNPPRPQLKSFAQEETILNTSDKIARLEAKIAVLEHTNAQLTQTCEAQSTKVALLQRFCKYHAIKLKIEDTFERETSSAQAVASMRSELAGLSLGVGGGNATISGIAFSPRATDTTNAANAANATNLATNAALKVRYDRRVHGGGDGIQNRFSYGSESVSRHKWMGPADGVASPRLQNSTGNAEDNKFRIRVSKDIHGLGSKDAQLVYGSKEYERRLVEEAKAHLERKDNRRKKIRGPDETKTDLFGRPITGLTPRGLSTNEFGQRENSEVAKLDESLFAGMLNPKEARNVSNERHGTDLRSEAQLQHRSQYRGNNTTRPAEVRLFKNS